MAEGLRRTALCLVVLAGCAQAPAGKTYEQQRADYLECREYAERRADALPDPSSMQSRQERNDDAFAACMRARARAGR